MKTPSHPVEIFLTPGDYHFAGQDTSISTVLGSCVSMTFWHPKLRVGGMCHYMLPERGRNSGTDERPALDGRYADEAMALLLKKIDIIGAAYKEYQVRLFGGGNMFPKTYKNTSSQIGLMNVQAGRRLIKQYGFICADEHLGETGHRSVVFEVWSGTVRVKHWNMSLTANYEPINRSPG